MTSIIFFPCINIKNLIPIHKLRGTCTNRNNNYYGICSFDECNLPSCEIKDKSQFPKRLNKESIHALHKQTSSIRTCLDFSIRLKIALNIINTKSTDYVVAAIRRLEGVTRCDSVCERMKDFKKIFLLLVWMSSHLSRHAIL